MAPVLQRISDGLGKFVNKIMEQSEYNEETSDPTEFVESSERMESADSFKIAELLASSTQKKSANVTLVQSAAPEEAECHVSGESVQNVESNPSEPITPSCSDQVEQLPDVFKTVPPDPVTLNIAGASETVNPVEIAETESSLKNANGNPNNTPQLSVKIVSSRYCQTEDLSPESGVVDSTETTRALEFSVVVVNHADPSVRPTFGDIAVQTVEVDEEFLPMQPAKKSMETSAADSAKMMASTSVTSSNEPESDDTCVTADSSGTLPSPECAKRVDSPSSSESWTSQSTPTMVAVAHHQESLSGDPATKKNLVGSTDEKCSTKTDGKNCDEVCIEKNGSKTYTELTVVKNSTEQVNDSTKSWIKERAEANLESYLQITAVELSSTGFTLEDNNSLPDDDESFYDALKNWYDTNAVAITFDGSCSDQPSIPIYGDVSSTNTFVGGETTTLRTNKKLTTSTSDLTALLRECGFDQEFESQQTEVCKDTATKEQRKEPVMEPHEESAAERFKEPVGVQPCYPAAVATSPDSTEDGIQLRVLPCSVIVPRAEVKFPQYAHLVRQAIKRKKKVSEDSVLRKKFRSEINQKILLSSVKLSNAQLASQLQKSEKNKRIGDFSSSGFKQPKAKKSKRSRESHEPKPVQRKSKSVELVAKFVSSPKADLTKYHIPKLKIGPAHTVDGRKENIPKPSDVLKNKISDVPNNRGSPLRSKNAKISPKRRDSGMKTAASLTSPKNGRKDSSAIFREPSSKNKTSSPRRSPRINDSKTVSPTKPPQTGTLNRDLNICEDLSQLDPLILPGMPELSPWEPMDFDVAKSQPSSNEKNEEQINAKSQQQAIENSQRQTDEKSDQTDKESRQPTEEIKTQVEQRNERPVTAPVESDKVIHVHDFPKLVSKIVTSINSPERRENSMRTESSEGISKNKYSGLSSSNRKVTFGLDHTFRIIDCENKLSCPVNFLLPEPHILGAINARYLPEVKKTKLLSLKWSRRYHHPESRPIRSPVYEPKFDCSEYIGMYDKSTFEKLIRNRVHSRLRKVIAETKYQAETTNETDFVIDKFEGFSSDCLTIILKRETNINETGKLKVGDLVSLTLFTKSKNLNDEWKETIIFGYTDKVDVIMNGVRLIQEVHLSVHPIDYDVKCEKVKVQPIVNISPCLILLTASVVIPYSKVVDLFTISSINESKTDASAATDAKNEFTELEQSVAVKSCYEGILSDNPFLYFIDGAPGTGKSHFIVKLIQKLGSEKQNSFLKILIVTQSHASGDDILRRLIKSQSESSENLNILRYGAPNTIHPSLKKYMLCDSNYILEKPSFDMNLEKRIFEAEQIMQKNREASEPINESVEPTNKSVEQTNKSAEANVLRTRYVVGSADVVIVSRDACYEGDFVKDFTPYGLDKRIFNKFSVCIFDDANEMSEIDLLVPVMTMVSNLVLIGNSKVRFEHDTSLTPFSQLLEKYRKTFPKNTIDFKTQFRVHPKIMDCLDKMNMSIGSTHENVEPKIALKPLMIVDLPSKDESLDHSKSFEAQAKLCKNIVQNMLKVKEFENLRIGVLVGKKKQKHLISEELKSFSKEILVGKVATFDFVEKDLIIGCMATFLHPDKFLFTAMTKAKRSVIICGDFSRYKGQEAIQELIDNANRRKCYKLWENDPSDFPFQTLRLFFNTRNQVTPSSETVKT